MPVNSMTCCCGQVSPSDRGVVKFAPVVALCAGVCADHPRDGCCQVGSSLKVTNPDYRPDLRLSGAEGSRGLATAYVTNITIFTRDLAESPF